MLNFFLYNFKTKWRLFMRKFFTEHPHAHTTDSIQRRATAEHQNGGPTLAATDVVLKRYLKMNIQFFDWGGFARGA